MGTYTERDNALPKNSLATTDYGSLESLQNVYTYVKYIQVTLLQNLIVWDALHTAICQILFRQR